MPHRLPRDLIAGFAMDAADWQPRSEDDLLTYCYHVAGVVGVTMGIVMGVDSDDEAVLDRACDLGLAFQLVNISRDFAEEGGGRGRADGAVGCQGGSGRRKPRRLRTDRTPPAP